jgi:hypothetical protein
MLATPGRLFRPRLETLERRDCPAALLGVAGDVLARDEPTSAGELPPCCWVFGTELPAVPPRRDLVTLLSMDVDFAAPCAMDSQLWDAKTEQARQITFIQDL